MPEHTPAPTPHRAVYGYAFYLLVITLFVFYFLWVLLPTKEWGLTYLPDKYFAVLLPMLVLVALSFFAFFIYPAINMSLTPDVNEMASVADVALIFKGKFKKQLRSWSELREETIPLPTKVLNLDNSFIENCKYCLGHHNTQKESEQIDTLHFMDLGEVNKNLFN